MPTGVADEVPMVTADEPPDVIADGLNDTKVPPGMPEAVKVSGIGLPATTVVVTVVDATVPALTATTLGDTAIEKESGGTAVVTLIVADGPDVLPAASRALTEYW